MSAVLIVAGLILAVFTEGLVAFAEPLAWYGPFSRARKEIDG